MARGDGIHRTSARNMKMTTDKVKNAQGHNEREKESYVNQDIIPERQEMNVHFKTPTDDYTTMFDQMAADGTISTRGLKADADKFGELIFDVNSAYFYNNGGYEFAKEFFAEAYKAAVKIVGDEKYILLAVMHADERNRAMSEALGRDVYHYHLHVVYVPVVEKEVLWTKRCKDPALVGTVKERIMQVSMSKKWASKPALDENGEVLRTKSGKPVLRKSYSVLQDDFYNHMRNAGYTDIERGERGSSEEHLTVTQFKVERERERLADLTEQTQQKEAESAALDKQIEKSTQKKVSIERIDKIEAKPMAFSSRVSLEKTEYETLSAAAKKFYAQEKKESKLQKLLDAANKAITELKEQIASLTAELMGYKSTYAKLHPEGLEKENNDLRNKVRRYESVIDKHRLWHLFGRGREKDLTK